MKTILGVLILSVTHPFSLTYFPLISVRAGDYKTSLLYVFPGAVQVNILHK